MIHNVPSFRPVLRDLFNYNGWFLDEGSHPTSSVWSNVSFVWWESSPCAHFPVYFVWSWPILSLYLSPIGGVQHIHCIYSLLHSASLGQHSLGLRSTSCILHPRHTNILPYTIHRLSRLMRSLFKDWKYRFLLYEIDASVSNISMLHDIQCFLVCSEGSHRRMLYKSKDLNCIWIPQDIISHESLTMGSMFPRD